jgi:anaphase-promoting complex subunit 6
MRTPPLVGTGVMPRQRSGGGGASTARTVQTLRQRVRGCIDRHHIASALFYADKLATLSPDEPTDVLLFAETCFLHREYHRAIHIVTQASLLAFESPYTIPETTLQAYLLVGQSMLAIKHKEECLDLLAKVLPDDEVSILAFAKRYSAHAQDSGRLNIVASLALLMGETFEGVGNRDNALIYYRLALQCDVHCAEAFFHLVEKQMLSTQEQARLMESLDFSAEDADMLRELYGVHTGMYETSPSTNVKFARVEEMFGLRDNVELVRIP